MSNQCKMCDELAKTLKDTYKYLNIGDGCTMSEFDEFGKAMLKAKAVLERYEKEKEGV